MTGATLTLTFSEALGAAASLANSAFTVKKTPQGGAEQTVSLSGSPAISGGTVTLTLASAVLDTDTGVRVSYEKPASGANNRLIDVAGNEAASFRDEPVVNTADTTPPRLVRGEIDGDTLSPSSSASRWTRPRGVKGDYLPDQPAVGNNSWRGRAPRPVPEPQLPQLVRPLPPAEGGVRQRQHGGGGRLGDDPEWRAGVDQPA